ncbi:MAG: 3-hydroxyisobutyrate dehydrogenase related beta-hydroxyacid dehydrogenase [uncultured archaeon A07HB70]|nr:MAG: 3-hydroxyisobutyrate dehydrogenase related beta-hydroxyacid dehydrogenase [uncultured archaeon A07HB70]
MSDGAADDRAAPAVGVVGLGTIGSRLARVLSASFDVVGFDVDEAAADRLDCVEGCDAAVAVGRRADVVLLSLPGDDALGAATEGEDGVVAGLGPGDVLVDTSTVSPGASARAARAAHEAGADFLDAPVSGGARNAETGDLTVLVGGDADVLARVRPVLDAVARTVHRVGPLGAGATLKLVNNYLFALNQLALAEGLTMARAAGVDDETFAETVAESSGGSYALDRNMERFVIPDDYDSEFTLDLMAKDARLAERFAAERETPLLLGGASGLYEAAAALGHGDLDASAVLKLYERLTARE